jgi:hypothetical protein
MTRKAHEADVDERELVRTARITGLFYLGICVTAIFGYFIIRGQVFDPGDAAATLSHLAEQETLARLGIVMELGTGTLMALLALWFYRLFRSVDGFLAVAVMVLGELNAVALLGSTAFLGTALEVALDPSLAGAAATAQLMYVVSANFWHIGTVSSGLWLIPMGLLVLRSGWMPRAMGWLLNIGGVGYVLYACTLTLAPDAAPLASVLTWPSVSEFWMAGYLLVKGVRRPAADAGRSR